MVIYKKIGLPSPEKDIRKELPSKGMSSRRLNLLVVDDHVNTLRIMSVVIKGMGHSAITVDNGPEALEIFRQGGIDLVISDFNMYPMNGLELLEQIMKHDPCARVIIATSNAFVDREQLLRAGAINVVEKPLDLSGIRGMVDSAGAD